MIFRGLLSLAAVCALLLVPGYAAAQGVIWDSPPNNDLPAFVDQQFADFPEFSTYIVGHVDITRKTQIFEVTTYFTNFNNLWPQGTIEAVLNIFSQDGSLPPNSYDPSGPQQGGNGTKVIANLQGIGDRLELTTSLPDNGIDLVLQPGEYWFGLTPKLEFGVFGQEFHKGSDFFLKNSAARNPGGGFGVGTDWFEAGPVFGGVDWGMAVTVTGKNIPEPTSVAVLALGLVGLVARRRR